MSTTAERHTFQIPDPTFLLTLYNKEVREKRVKLHPWQVRYHQEFAQKDFDYKTQVKRILLVANNGSGKSAMIVAPCSVWLCMFYPDAHAVITSSSGVQLDRQTGRAINHLCQQINAFHGRKIWDLKYREYRNNDTGSVIDMYATDEPGKAEGYHPLVPGGMFVIFPDEAKSIPDTLFEPISRCNGMSHFCPVSSPGKPAGLFYRMATSARWRAYKVTAYDCPHIKQDEIEEAKEIYGEFSAFFRSAYLAEFTSIDEQVVIPYETIYKLYKEPPPVIDDKKLRAGVDISGGGDESVVSVWRGNQQIGLESFRFTDPRAIVIHLVFLLKEKYKVPQEEVNIDDGYIGRAIIADLKDHGLSCNAVRFGARAFRPVAYGNRGTEMWFNFQRLIQYLRFIEDKTQMNQLSSRYYSQSDTTAKIVLESKREAKAKGHHSPDRADADVLAWARVPPSYFQELGYKAAETRETDSPTSLIDRLLKDRNSLSEEEIAEAAEQYRAARTAKERTAVESFGNLSRRVSGGLRQMLGIGKREGNFINIGRK